MQHLRAAWHPSCPTCLQTFHPCTVPHTPIPMIFLLSFGLFPHSAASSQSRAPWPHISPASQPWSPALHLNHCMCVTVTVVLYSSCRGAYWREDRGRRKEQSLQDPGLQSIMGPLKVTISVSWCWELKTLGMPEICEVEATVEPGQQWTWRSADLNTNLLLKIKWKCRLQMQYSKTCFKSG